LLNGKAGRSGEMALRIEKAFGVKMDTLMHFGHRLLARQRHPSTCSKVKEHLIPNRSKERQVARW
jgi:plasmid maintenance system antidote protein VapI